MYLNKICNEVFFVFLWVIVNRGPHDSKDIILLLSSPRSVNAMLLSPDCCQYNECVQVETLDLRGVGLLYSSRYGFAFPDVDFTSL